MAYCRCAINRQRSKFWSKSLSDWVYGLKTPQPGFQISKAIQRFSSSNRLMAPLLRYLNSQMQDSAVRNPCLLSQVSIATHHFQRARKLSFSLGGIQTSLNHLVPHIKICSTCLGADRDFCPTESSIRNLETATTNNLFRRLMRLFLS